MFLPGGEDLLLDVLAGPVRTVVRRRGAVHQADLAVGVEAGDPPVRALTRDCRRLRRMSGGPPLTTDPIDQQAPTMNGGRTSIAVGHENPGWVRPSTSHTSLRGFSRRQHRNRHQPDGRVQLEAKERNRPTFRRAPTIITAPACWPGHGTSWTTVRTNSSVTSVDTAARRRMRLCDLRWSLVISAPPPSTRAFFAAQDSGPATVMVAGPLSS